MAPSIEPGVFMRIMALPQDKRRDLLEIAGLLRLPSDRLMQIIDEALTRGPRELRAKH